jgi:hypothetical protein
MLNRVIRFLTISLIFFSIAALFFQSTQAQSEQQEPGVFRSDKLEMFVKAGFGKLEVTSWEGNWTPFRVSLANFGDQIVGRIVITSQAVANQNAQGREFVKDIQLPTGSRQQHEIPVFLRGGSDVDVILEVGGRTVAKTSLPVERQTGNSDQLQIAVVDNDSTTLNNISAMLLTNRNNNQTPRVPFEKVTPENTIQVQTQEDPNQAQNNPQQNRRRGRPFFGGGDVVAHPVVIAPEDLPRDFISYQPVNVVVLGDAPLNQLTEDQGRALKSWVASGGMLIVTGGADLAGLRAAKLDDIIPVEAQGSITIPAVAELTDLYGEFDAPAALLVMSGRTRANAKTILGTDEKPLVAESRYGNGLVRFVAFNPKLNPYRSWSNGRYLWSDLLNPALDTRTYFPRRGNFSDYLYSLADIKAASSSYFLFFLLAYVVIVGPVNYLVLKKMKKLDLAWLTIPAVALLFTIISIGVAQFKKTDAVAADGTLVEFFQNDGIKNIRGGFLLRSDSAGTQTISLDSKTAFAVDNNTNGPPPVGEAIELERKASHFTLHVPTTNGSPSYFSTRAVSESQPQMIATREANANSIKVKNLGDAEITNAVFISNAGVSDLFSIAAGEEKQIALNSPQSLPFADWYAAKLPQESGEVEMFDGLAGTLLRGTAKNKTRLQAFLENEMMNNVYKNIEHSMLIGFADKAPTTIDFSNASKRRSKSLYVVYL